MKAEGEKEMLTERKQKLSQKRWTTSADNGGHTILFLKLYVYYKPIQFCVTRFWMEKTSTNVVLNFQEYWQVLGVKIMFILNRITQPRLRKTLLLMHKILGVGCS